MSGFTHHIALLPATDPADATYGSAPAALAAYPHCAIHRVSFPALVWYNTEVRARAVAMMRELGPERFVLVGFSKSGLGAILIALEHPELVASVLVFDVPLAHRELPPWQTSAFYTQETWARDLPIDRIDEIRALLRRVRLVHVAGATFAPDHDEFARSLADAGANHVYVRDPARRHHWGSGWLEEHLALALTSP